MRLITQIAATVGTSLLSNLELLRDPQRLSESADSFDCPPADLRRLVEAVESSEWRRAGILLAQLVPPTDRLSGAEIASLHALAARPQVQLHSIHLLLSDTDAGRGVGELLHAYFATSECFSTPRIQTYEVEGLDDTDAQRFAASGLRNLARQTGRIVRTAGTDHLLLNVTGGYKAQVAVLALLGQALGLPVAYLHERFATVVDFPPLPVTYDLAIVERYAELLWSLEEEPDQGLSQLPDAPELEVLLEQVEVEGHRLVALSPVGQILLEAYRGTGAEVQPDLAPCPPGQRRAPSFRDDHYPTGFREWVHRLWEDNPWICTCQSRGYSGQASIKHGRFYVQRHGERRALIGEYKQDDFGARVEVIPSPAARRNLEACAAYLDRQHERG